MLCPFSSLSCGIPCTSDAMSTNIKPVAAVVLGTGCMGIAIAKKRERSVATLRADSLLNALKDLSILYTLGLRAAREHRQTA